MTPPAVAAVVAGPELPSTNARLTAARLPRRTPDGPLPSRVASRRIWQSTSTCSSSSASPCWRLCCVSGASATSAAGHPRRRSAGRHGRTPRPERGLDRPVHALGAGPTFRPRLPDGASVWIFGSTAFAVRLPLALVGIAAIPLTYVLFRLLSTRAGGGHRRLPAGDIALAYPLQPRRPLADLVRHRGAGGADPLDDGDAHRSLVLVRGGGRDARPGPLHLQRLPDLRHRLRALGRGLHAAA